jgi:hypothetical protein
MVARRVGTGNERGTPPAASQGFQSSTLIVFSMPVHASRVALTASTR